MKRERVRSLKLPSGGVDFTSNDYLGLARSEVLYRMIADAMTALPQKRNGSTGSRLLSGNSPLAEQTEQKLAAIFGTDAALMFDSGYNANLAVLSTLPQRGDTILMDELSHASLKDGARLSLATKWSFRHNDLADLKNKLGSAKGEKWVVAESIYSMDGDECPLDDIVALADEFGAHVILDEAHSTGLSNHSKKIAVRVCTFGKAMGVHGACVCSSADIRDELINFSRPFIYTTAPSDYSLASVSCAFDFLEANAHLKQQLRSNIDYFRSIAPWSASNSQIQVAVIPGRENVVRAASRLQAEGFDVRPILSPTVKEGQERLRICLHTFNTQKEIKAVVDATNKS
ncbi:MAG TPA: aminotransferase class I/II-fold pyridoxal phosphate-dependent enzyme [Cyclobacteriaceae bacterium]